MLDDENIDELSNKWLKLLQDKEDNGALELYCKGLIPCMLPGLHKLFRETYNQEAYYDGLISLQGFTPDTVILAYQFVQPKTMVVLYTEETKHLLDTVVKLAHIPQYKFFHEPFREAPYDDIYRALNAALKRFPKDARIAIELTGGKKTMGGALAIASGMLDIDLLYIDYQEYMPEFRKPKPKSTYIHLVGNPLKLSTDLFGNLEIRRAVEFFNIGKYDSSKALFEDIGRRMANPRAVEFGAKLSQFYLQWDSFAFEEAHKHAESLSYQISHFQDQILSHFSISLKRLERQFEGIEELAGEARQSIMWNFYFGALRHEKNGLYDIAALLYYRTLEDILDNALKDVASDFDRSKPDYSLFGIDSEELTNRLMNFRAGGISRKTTSTIEQHLPIAMVDAFCLLGALNSPLVKKFKAPKIMNIAQIRNLSVYAHGLHPMNQKALSDIRQLATDMILVYAEIKGFSSIDVQSDKFSFMELTMREKSEYSSK
jgi:CRISPR-associated protein (TIGR02710 family)